MHPEEIVLFPQPSDVEWTDDAYSIGRDGRIALAREHNTELFPIAEGLAAELREECGAAPRLAVGKRGDLPVAVAFESAPDLDEEGYRLTVAADGIEIDYGDLAGAFYATRTLKQLVVQCGRSLPGVEIVDAPDFEERGLMLDIGRNKIPTVETVRRIVDLMADLKLNHLQLYIEGFPFAYPSFPQVWADGTPLTGEDLMAIDRYCEERFVDFVPNQNSFGHMSDWLAEDEFEHLAESPDGFEMWGDRFPPSTLDPTNPESIEFLAETYDDFLPYFSDDRFNVGCDETFELGEGKSAEACEERGAGRVYLDHLMNVYDLLDERDKRMLFWGDIINEYPDLVPELPPDVTVLEWGYEADHPFDERAENYADVGIPFYVCPGTSSWNSITGRTENMKGNLRSAAESGLKHGARGYLITDWGDNGHWQPLPVSYPGYAYGGALAWGLEENVDAPVAAYLDRLVFRDGTGTVGQLLLDLGDYYRREDEPTGNETNVFRILNSAFDSDVGLDNVSRESLAEIDEYVADLQQSLRRAEMDCDDAALVERELANAARMVRHGARLGRMKLADRDGDEFEALLDRNAGEIDEIVGELRQVWLERNRYGDLDDSLERLNRLRETYEGLKESA